MEESEEKIVKCSYIPSRKTLKVNKMVEGQEPVVIEKTNVEKGFELEELIFNASLKLPGLVHSYRENDIKKHFAEPSLNGVDHWIQVGNTHILLQDKWKESHNQQEVSQFLTCAMRIQERLGSELTGGYGGGTRPPHLIWASKRKPTSNSLKMLKERGVHMIMNDVSTEELAKTVVKKIMEMVSEDIMG